MSWDVSILKWSRIYKTIEEIPHDESPHDLGTRTFVQEEVSREFPGTDWSDPVWGVWESSDGSIEFNLGEDDPSTGLMLHVRANANVIPAIVRLCRRNAWQAIDCGSSNLIDQQDSPSEGLDAWSAYRDRVIQNGGDGQ